MNASPNKLNEYITLYLNDVEDYYSGEKDLTLVESTLNSLKQLIVESKQDDISIILKEALMFSSPEKKEIIEDLVDRWFDLQI